jgi:hypothetical protein
LHNLAKLLIPLARNWVVQQLLIKNGRTRYDGEPTLDKFDGDGRQRMLPAGPTAFRVGTLKTSALRRKT